MKKQPMTLLDGFRVIPLKEKVGDTFLTISEKSLKLNRETAKILGMPAQVLFLINDKRMQIAVTPARRGDEDAVDFTVEEGGREKPIYVREPAILKEIRKLAILERDGVKLTQTIKGLVYPEEKVIIYDLGESVEAVVKPRVRRKAE